MRRLIQLFSLSVLPLSSVRIPQLLLRMSAMVAKLFSAKYGAPMPHGRRSKCGDMASATLSRELWRLTWLIYSLIIERHRRPVTKAERHCRPYPRSGLPEADIADVVGLCHRNGGQGLDLILFRF